MPMNVELLRRVKEHILAEPDRYNQNTIADFGKPGETHQDDGDFRYPECGTIACIGGWMDLLTRKRKPKHSLLELDVEKLIGLTGLSVQSFYRLCAFTWSRRDNESWPAEFRTRYNYAKTATERAQVAADRIEHFIATNGAE